MSQTIALVAQHAQDTGASVTALCHTLALSRATFYRNQHTALAPNAPTEPTDMAVRDAIQTIALEFPCYGFTSV